MTKSRVNAHGVNGNKKAAGNVGSQTAIMVGGLDQMSGDPGQLS
jgi:hypothetical protein